MFFRIQSTFGSKEETKRNKEENKDLTNKVNCCDAFNSNTHPCIKLTMHIFLFTQ